MRIRGWRVDGFGIFTGAVVEDLPDGLTIVSGPNEAGKSTLLAFLRGVLFGFPDGRSRARRHEPVHGGRHGGAVSLVDASGGSWQVERHVDPRALVVRGPDGAVAEDHRLADLLGHADATLFGNVFAFGLGELDAFELLDSDAVRDRVFSAGVVGAGRSARAALSALDDRRSELLRPRGRCEIRELAEQAREGSRDLAAARAAALDLVHRRDVVDRLADDAVAAREAVDTSRATARRTAALLDAWPAQARVRALETELDDLVVPESVGEDLGSRLDAVHAELAASTAAFERAELDLAAALERRDVITVDDDLAAAADDVRVVADGLGAEEVRTARLGELDGVVERRRAELEGQLARLGPDWDRAHLAAFDVSIPAADEVRRRGEALVSLESQLADTTAARDDVRRELQEADALVGALESEEHDEAAERELERRTRALRQLRADLVDLGTETARLDAATGSVSGLSAMAQRARGRGQSIGLLFVSAGIVLGLFGIAALVGGGETLGAGLAVTGASALVLGIVVLLSRRSASNPEVAASLKAELREAERARDEVVARVELLRTRVQASALVLGLPSEPHAQDVEARAAEIGEAQRTLERRASSREQEGALVARTGVLRGRLADLDSDVASLEVRTASARSDWERWKDEHRVPSELGVAALNDLFTAIERARASLRDLEAAERERDRLDELSSEWRARASELCDRLGAEDSADLVSEMRVLSERVAADAAARRSLEERIAAVDDAEQRSEDVADRLALARQEREALFALAEVDDEESARQVVQRWRRRRDLLVELDAARDGVRAALGRGADSVELLDALAAGTVEGWEAALSEAQSALPDLEAAHEEAIRAHHDAERELEELSRSADVAEAALRFEGVRTRLADAVEEWRTYTAARTLIADTLARYERERQPAVMSRAEAMFSRITDGHYRSISVADGEISLIDNAGRRLTTDDLSRGTAEQLYLCLRFGLAAEMVSHTPLPFVMDDVLVNFDPERTRHMAEVIAGLAADHQVLLFTCQPATVDTLLAVAPDTRVIELPRHGGT